MIILNVMCKDHRIDIDFPCSEMILQSKMMEIHSDNPDLPEAYVMEVIEPRELAILEGNTHNLDEMNYLAKRLDSFTDQEMAQYFVAAKFEGFRGMKDLINLTFNLQKYTLIQDISSMAEVGRNFILNNKGGMVRGEFTDKELAEKGWEIIRSGKAEFTDYGLLYVDEDMKFQPVYDGENFPLYYYDSDHLVTAEISKKRKKEYLFLPCEDLAIQKAMFRVGAQSYQHVDVELTDATFDNKEWFDRLCAMAKSENIYILNALTDSLNDADMDFVKLSAAVELADVDDASSIGKIADHIDMFVFIENAEDDEAVGHFFIDNYSEYSLNPDLEDYFDFDAFGRHMREEQGGEFVSDGFVCMEQECDIDDILDEDDSMTMGGM